MHKLERVSHQDENKEKKKPKMTLKKMFPGLRNPYNKTKTKKKKNY